MQLSNRAAKYIKSLNRDNEWVTTEAETRSYLNKLNCNYSDTLVQTQLSFGGLELKVKGSSRFNETIHFISKDFIRRNVTLQSKTISNELLISLDNNHDNTTYYITLKGKICTIDYEMFHAFYYTFENLNTKIEQFALLNEYYYLTNHFSENYNVLDINRLKTEFSDFKLVAECSDRYNFCCMNEQIIVLVSPWLESDGHFVKIYGINTAAWKNAINRIQHLID